MQPDARRVLSVADSAAFECASGVLDRGVAWREQPVGRVPVVGDAHKQRPHRIVRTESGGMEYSRGAVVEIAVDADPQVMVLFPA